MPDTTQTKGIKTKPRTEKEKLKARMDSFSDVDNARVSQLKTRSSNGFKGERLNDYGLPLGDNLGKETPIIQSGSMDTDNPESNAKFRKQKYADGTKGIKLKPKTSVDSDATKVSMTEPVNLKKKYSESLGKMSDKEQMDEVGKNTTGFPGYKLTRKGSEAADSVASRNYKRQGGYADGTKSVKTTGGLKNFIENKGFKSKEDAANSKYKSMSDREVAEQVNNTANSAFKVKYPNDSFNPNKDQANNLDAEYTRSMSELNRRAKTKYAMGTKSIKTKKMC